MLEAGLHSLITGDASFSAQCADRLYPLILPEGVDTPAVTYHRITTTRKRLLDGDADRTSSLMQFDVWSTSYAATKQVADILLNLLEGFTGTLPDGTELLSSELSSCHDLYESEARLYRVSMDLRFTT